MLSTEGSSHHVKSSSAVGPIASSAECEKELAMHGSPTKWWEAFSALILPSAHSGQILDVLSKAVQCFPVDRYRMDPVFLKIWLAFLEAHFAIYEDVEECRRLFKFLKSEHVGGPALLELYLHWAKFELSVGKTEKALAVLQSALEASALQRNPQLLSTIELLKLTGKLKVASVLLLSDPSPKQSQDFMPINEVLQYSQLQSQPKQDSFSLFAQQQQQPRRESIASISSIAVPRISPNEAVPPGSSLSSVARLRRAGLGPPKRATMPPLSPLNDDSTVPRNYLASSSSLGHDGEFSTPPRQKERSQMMSIDPSPLSNLSKSRLNYTDAPLTDAADDDEEDEAVDMVKDRLEKSTLSNPHQSETTSIVKTRAVKISGKTYRVLHLIGKGGSSKVFKVLAPDNQVLALKKVNLKNLDENTLSGYVNEIELLKSLGNDENIIRLIDSELNRHHGSLYIIMEYGEIDLCQMLKQRSAKDCLDYNFIRHCWQQMLQAVKRVHAAKVVHCDLKPANFLMVKGNLKLIDFGISKAIMNDTTNIVRENQVGTVNYMSPEALQESSSSAKGLIKIGRPSDVWSLGCILYEMAFGKPPFAPFSLIHRLQKIMDSSYQIEYPPLDDPALLDAIKGCLHRSSKHRFTIEGLLDHAFLKPHTRNIQTTPPKNKVLVSQDQIEALLKKFAEAHPEIDPHFLSLRIFKQWQQDS